MEKTKTSLFENGLIWFGAAVSIAEILTGTYIAPLGFRNGLLAVLIGHVIGCIMLFFAGLIGGRAQKSAMETVKMSFGRKGALLFSVLNILQLLGWTAVMIYDGALAANEIFDVGSWIAVGAAIAGTVSAIFFPVTDITDFLYFIGSVFAPMIAIQIVDFFVLKKNKEEVDFCMTNLVIWLIGFVVYRWLMRVDIVIGNTLPDMVITMAVCVLAEKWDLKNK